MSSPQVGDVLTTIEQLDACPPLTVLHAGVKGPAELWTVGWRRAGDDGRYSARDLLQDTAEWTVLWLPPVTEIEATATVIDRGCNASQIGALAWDDDGAAARLLDGWIGERVRVTVRKIGDGGE